MSETFSRLCSTKIARSAPRLSASRPSAPVPANRSTTTRPTIASRRMLKSDSRTRSLVGRVALPFGPSILCPRRSPEMIRMRPEPFPSRRVGSTVRPATVNASIVTPEPGRRQAATVAPPADSRPTNPRRFGLTRAARAGHTVAPGEDRAHAPVRSTGADIDCRPGADRRPGRHSPPRPAESGRGLGKPLDVRCQISGTRSAARIRSGRLARAGRRPRAAVPSRFPTPAIAADPSAGHGWPCTGL